MTLKFFEGWGFASIFFSQVFKILIFILLCENFLKSVRSYFSGAFQIMRMMTKIEEKKVYYYSFSCKKTLKMGTS